MDYDDFTILARNYILAKKAYDVSKRNLRRSVRARSPNAKIRRNRSIARAVSDIDGDDSMEIITGGYYRDSITHPYHDVAQLCLWGFT